MSGVDVWTDFETTRHNIKHNTVDKLKQILTGFNDECSTSFFKSGKKQELIDRIVSQLDIWRQTNNADKWIKAKAVLQQVKTSGVYNAGALSAHPLAQSAPIVPHIPYATSSTKPFTYTQPVSGSSSVGRYDPFSSPRKVVAPVAPAVASTSSPSTAPKGLRFRPSPFFRIDQTVSTIVECPESTSATDRRQQTLIFTLNNEQIAKLKSTSVKYQLRLFCTSSVFYSPSLNNFRTNTGPCAIEFPPTCEVRVNTVPLVANLKGLKKKPGTAPPADLGKAVRISPVQNRVEMIYVNSQQPLISKRYYLVVMLIEVTSVEQLVDRLKKGKYRSSSEVRSKMFAATSEDDDIIAGPQKMSLKCPLSFMRVKTPCRSIHCVHLQCFDATSWYSMMEQTTTWLCPVCEKVLNVEDLIIDGYFDEILRLTPESVEDVMVESNGEWHTSDNGHASAAWRAAHPPQAAENAPHQPTAPIIKSSEIADYATTDQNGEILVLDSDDEDEGQVKRQLSPSYGRRGSSVSANRSLNSISVPQTQTQSGAEDDVIDLTLDSDDEGVPSPEPPPSRRGEKRKASEGGMSPTEQIWKKGRQEIDPLMGLSLPNESPMNGPNSPNGLDPSTFPHYSSHRSQSSSSQGLSYPSNASPPAQYLAPFSTGLSTYSYTRPPPPRNPSVSSDPRLSAISRNFLPRMNSRWPGA